MVRRSEPVFHFLVPSVRTRYLLLMRRLNDAHQRKETPTHFRPFEIYRSPERQNYLYKQGTSKAEGMESPHQFGLAVDFVPYTATGWSWGPEHDYPFLKAAAQEFALDVPIPWDQCHVEAPEWSPLRALLFREKPHDYYNGG